MKKNIYFCAVALLFFAMNMARADINYHELEVYPYQTASPNEMELENATSASSGANVGGEAVAAYRSTFEFTYGVSERWELTAYADFLGQPQQNVNFSRARVHGRTHFFEKGELPVDLGAYVELELPQNDAAKLETEFRGIIERDFDRFTVDLNPILERPVVTTENAQFEVKFATAVAYRLSHTVKPHLDTFGSVTGDTQFMISPAIDVRVARGFTVAARAGFGLTDATEKTLGGVRMEYEF